MLIRCCEVSANAHSNHTQPRPEPLHTYGDPACQSAYLMPIQQQATDILFIRTSYIKKLIENANVTEDTVKLLQYYY